MVYLWRTHRLKAYTAAANEAKTKKEENAKKKKNGIIQNRRPGYYFINRQTAAFEQVQKAAASMVAAKDDAYNERWNNNEKNKHQNRNIKPLKKHMLAFFITLLNYNIENYEYQNALYSGLFILEIGVEYG
jgi:hypothetical protein